jgi:hypothetical protein
LGFSSCAGFGAAGSARGGFSTHTGGFGMMMVSPSRFFRPTLFLHLTAHEDHFGRDRARPEPFPQRGL